jgi:DNA-binding transcriptional LysR family regulator
MSEASLQRNRYDLKKQLSFATMDIDPRRLRVLRAVALREGVMDAARLLHITPSAVSQQLTQLEREVGVALVDRSRRRVELTVAGRLLAARAGRIEAELEAAARELAAISGRVAGRVVVAGFQTAIRHLLTPTLQRLAVEHPDVQLSVVELEGPAAMRELRTGGLDIVVTENDGGTAPARPSRVKSEPLLEDQYRVVVPAAWASRARSLSALAAVPWVASPLENSCGRALERLARQHGFHPQRAHVCLEFPAVLALVAAGQGAAIVPLLGLVDGPARAVAVTAIRGVGFRWVAAVHRATGRDPEPVVRVVLDGLRQVAAERAAQG